MAALDSITGQDHEPIPHSKEALIAFAADNGALDKSEAARWAYLVEAKVLIIQKRKGIDVMGGALSLETISPEEVREALRTIEQGGMNINGFDKNSWNIAAMFASQNPESSDDIVMRWKDKIHPRLSASSDTRDEAVERLTRLYARNRKLIRVSNWFRQRSRALLKAAS